MECGKEVGDDPVRASAGAGQLRSLLSRDKTRLLQPPLKCPSPIDSDWDLLQATVEESLQLTQDATKANEIVVLGIPLR